MTSKKKKRPIWLIEILIALALVLLWEARVLAPNFVSPQAAGEDQAVVKKDNVEQLVNTNVDISNLEIPILMYHYIRVVDDPNDQLGINLSVTPERFSSQLDYLKTKGYETITFLDLKKGNIPEKPIILTFDDGYLDFFINAYPELQKRDMKAVSFVIANKIGGEYMGENQIKTLAENGIEIGSHTLSHPDLSISNSSKINNELIDSKQKLEQMTGREVISFCYPSGKYNDSVVESARAAGYDFAVTTNPGISKFKSPLILNRYRMNADTEISAYLK